MSGSGGMRRRRESFPGSEHSLSKARRCFKCYVNVKWLVWSERQMWVHVSGRKLVRLEIWVGVRYGTQTEGFVVSLEGVLWNHSPEGSYLKLEFCGG